MNLDLNNLFGKFNEMQENLQAMKKKLDDVLVEAEAGGGLIRVTATANRTIRKIEIAEDARQDPEMMEDLIVAAVNKAIERADATAKEEMQRMTKDSLPNIPGMDLSQFGL